MKRKKQQSSSSKEKKRFQEMKEMAKKLAELNPRRIFSINGKYISVDTKQLLQLKFPDNLDHFVGDPEECEKYGFVTFTMKDQPSSVTIRSAKN